MSKSITNEKFQELIKDKKSRQIIIIDKYTNARTRMLCQCIDCNTEFMKYPQEIKEGRGCPNCSRIKTNKLISNKSKEKAYSNIEFIEKLYSINKNIEPLDEYINSKTKIKCQCKICNYIWNPIANNLLMGQGCPNCKGKVFNIEELKKILKEKSLSLITNINEIHYKHDKFECKCNKCGYIFEANYSKLYKNGCPCCSGKIVVKGINDMWTTSPEIARLLLDPEDGYKYTKTSNKMVDFKCDCCGKLFSNKTINQVYYYGLQCQDCSDGLSFGEKFMLNILKYYNIDFKIHKKFEWSNNKEYDFYIDSYKYIVEMNGIQHYEETHRKNARSLQEEKDNDSYKFVLALNNGIKKENYIVINSSVIDADIIIQQIINSNLSTIINFNYNELYNLFINSQKSLMIEACRLAREDELFADQIAKELGLGVNTIRNYLKRGEKLGLCIYKTRKSGKARTIKYIPENKIFYSAADAAKYFNVNDSTILKRCNDENNIHFIFCETN